MFNTADIGLIAARSDRGFEVLSSRMTLGYAKNRAPDFAITDSTWFAVRAQRDASLFSHLLSQGYIGKELTFDGIPHSCSFQVTPSGWYSNGTHFRGDGIWSPRSLRYEVGGSSGRLFSHHDDFQTWQRSIRARPEKDLQDLGDLIRHLLLRQTFHQYDNPRQYQFEVEYPLYLARQETSSSETRVYFTTPHPVTDWHTKWKTPDDGNKGTAPLTEEKNFACLRLTGHHEEVVVDAIFDSEPVGPFRSRTTPIVPRQSAQASKPAPAPKVTFRVVNSHHQVQPSDPYIVVLERTTWNDHGIRSSFRVYTCVAGTYQRLGTWKIVDRSVEGKRQTGLPRSFERLPPAFVSLGQKLDTYERLVELERHIAIAILASLNDLLFKPIPEIERLDLFQTSLARLPEARKAFEGGREVLHRHGVVSSQDSSSQPTSADDIVLHVSANLPGFANPHELVLRFSGRPYNFGVRRAVVLVGPNGCGKTQLLGALARALCGLERKDVGLNWFDGAGEKLGREPFEHVLAVSYGAFDNFTVPQGQLNNVGYSYCGLRISPSASPDDQRISLDFERAMALAAEQILALNRGSRGRAWTEALRCVRIMELSEPSLSSAAILEILRVRLSAGQKVVALTLANLCTHLEAHSIVLHDEPETHLHPSLLSALLRAIHDLLDRFDSNAIFATHSLTPLQETPSTNVIILNRSDDGIVTVDEPLEQCFAATLDEISRVAFRSSFRDENFRTALKRLNDRYSVDEIRKFLGGKLGLGTEMLLASLQR
jgi:energy-coupling factor transporter ATP-binding protein EcfA2